MGSVICVSVSVINLVILLVLDLDRSRPRKNLELPSFCSMNFDLARICLLSRDCLFLQVLSSLLYIVVIHWRWAFPTEFFLVWLDHYLFFLSSFLLRLTKVVLLIVMPLISALAVSHMRQWSLVVLYLSLYSPSKVSTF